MFNKMQYLAVSLLWLLMSQAVQALDGTSFITKWQTLADGDTIQIPIHPDYAYNTNIDCDNDGVFEKTGITDQENMTCTYASAGEHIIHISGEFPSLYITLIEGENRESFINNTRSQLREVMQWGNIQWQSMAYAFYQARELQITALDTPLLNQVTDMRYMFAGVISVLGQSLNTWDVSHVTNMSWMFYQSFFDEDIGNWDVGNVTDMSHMFQGAGFFNQDLNSWNVSKVDDMSSMFRGAGQFNGNIRDWDVSNVTNMQAMFDYARMFNQDLNAWDVSKVTDMSEMFSNARAFNQDLNDWDVGQVTNMAYMFNQSSFDMYLSKGTFNGNISHWNVSNVTDMSGMFISAPFNQNIGAWNVSSVTDMNGMFRETPFNQDIGAWDVSNVTNMGWMLFKATAFNQDISAWDVSQVTSMASMFVDAAAFNQDIGAWDVSQVTSMASMFYNATAFNQDLSHWNVSQVTSMAQMFRGATRFNGNVTTWDVGQVTTMTAMFQDAAVFNQDISYWNVSNVTGMELMFYGASKFNQDLNHWDVSKVTQMQGMFAKAMAFNGNISAWDVSNVSQMDFLFLEAMAFNQDISTWNVSNVTSMASMFQGAEVFNQNIAMWNVSNVTDMFNMFNQSFNFNQNISAWDVSKVTNMNAMFLGATAFDQDLSAWNISQVTAMEDMFSGMTLSVANYDALLQAWSQLPLSADVVFSAGSSKYSAGSAAEAARATLINTYGWTINDNDSTAIPVDMTECGQMANGRSNITISSACHNDDWLFNVQVTETGSITGGVLSGKIDNQGIIQDVEMTNAVLEGGILSGHILISYLSEKSLNISSVSFYESNIGTNNIIQNVTFAADTVVESVLTLSKGLILRGNIIGDPLAPVVFNSVELTEVDYASHVILSGRSYVSTDNPTLYGQGVMPYYGSYVCDESIVANFAPELAPNTCLSSTMIDENLFHLLKNPIFFGQGVHYNRQEYTCDDPVSSLYRGTEPNACFVQADTILRIMPAPEHVGQTVDVVFLAVDDTYTYSYDGNFWQGNSLGVENVISAKTIAELPYTLDVTLPNLALFNVVFAGYRLSDGDIIYRRVK